MSDIFEPEETELPPIEEPIQEPEIDADEVASVLWNLVLEFEREDEDAHRTFFQEALRSEYYWTNRQHTFWNKKVDGFEIFDPITNDDYSEDYTVNIYRPNGESIIAAMSAALPKVDFYPDDADNADDLVTAEAYKRIALLIQKHNRAPLLVIRILYILYNQHFCAVYNYNQKSTKYGTWQKENFEDREVIENKEVCPICQSPMMDFTPPQSCEVCGTPVVTPEIQSERKIIRELTGYTDEPKSRERLNVFGPLHVRVAPYTQEQEDTPYVILDFERHPSLARRLYPDIKDKLKKGTTASNADYYRNFRASIYQGDCEHLDSWKMVWLRPWAYESKDLPQEMLDYLNEHYPDGVKLVFINDILAEIENEDLDDCWTLSLNPLSTYIYGEPIGKAGLPIQDATNELMNLSMDTVKHGIPINFVDSDTLDFKKFGETEVKPGMTFPVKVPSTRSIQDLISTTRTATLSQEVKDLAERTQQFSQFTVGAFPSIYGGVLQGSRTASEYAQSRAQALQRLSNTWTILKQLWADVMSKAAVSFARNLQYDEREVKKSGNGFINVWIRRAELTGKVGQVEPEIDEQLPTSWAQIRDVLLRLLEMNSPIINSILQDPENAVIVKNGFGMRDLTIPGYDDKLKQLQEIQEMMAGNPVMPDQLLDNHGIEASVCRGFLIGEVGQDLKRTNPQAYGLILQHYQMHMQILASQQVPAQQEQNQEPKPAGAE